MKKRDIIKMRRLIENFVLEELSWSDIKNYYGSTIRFMEDYEYPEGIEFEASILNMDTSEFITMIRNLGFIVNEDNDEFYIPSGYTATLVDSWDSNGANPGITIEKNNIQYLIDLDPYNPIIEILV